MAGTGRGEWAGGACGYANLFLKVLSAKGDALVPHVSLLGLDRQALQEVYEHERVSVAKAARSHLRKPCPQSVFEKIHWQASWSEYVRGNIVSESSKNLIQSFLLKTMASSTKGTDDIETEADESGNENEVPLCFCFGPTVGIVRDKQSIIRLDFFSSRSHSRSAQES